MPGTGITEPGTGTDRKISSPLNVIIPPAEKTGYIPIKGDIDRLKNEVDELQLDVGTNNKEHGELRKDIAKLRTDVVESRQHSHGASRLHILSWCAFWVVTGLILLAYSNTYQFSDPTWAVWGYGIGGTALITGIVYLFLRPKSDQPV